MPRANTIADLWACVSGRDYYSPGACWPWTGTLLSHEARSRYGCIKISGRKWLAHHLTLADAGRTVPVGMHSDHLCRTTTCVNPAHIEIVTCRVNVLRGVSPLAAKARQTHCKRGHRLAGKNLMLRRTGRACRACKNISARASHAARKHDPTYHAKRRQSGRLSAARHRTTRNAAALAAYYRRKAQ